mgnify:CR=1 FL=1
MYIILSFEEWFNSLTDKEVEELEQKKISFDEAYAEYVSHLQDMAYDSYKDDILMSKD